MQLEKSRYRTTLFHSNRRHLEQQRRRSRRSEVSSNKGNDHVHPSSCSNGSSSGTLYVMLDKQANGAAPAVTDVLTGTNMNNDLPNVPNQYRFKTVRRLQYAMTSPAGVTTAFNNVTLGIDEYIQFKKPIQLRYTASAGAITDLASNNLFLMAGSNSAQDDTVAFSGIARLRFTG